MLKFFTSDLRRNLTKIFCLTIGLAIGLLLVAKAFVEQSFDHAIPEYGNVYIVKSSAVTHGEFREYNQTAGAIAPGLKRYVPQVEMATRITEMLDGSLTVRTPDGRDFEAESITMADSCLFDVLRWPVISGDPHEALAVEDHCMIPRSLAEKIGGDVVGMTLVSPDFNKSYHIMIDGVYEDFPINSTFRNVIYLSLSSIVKFSYDGRENWVGNDRYKSYVRLAKGASAEEVAPHIRRMLKENVDNSDLETFKYNISLEPLYEVYASQDSVKTMIWILSLLAFIILVSASLNYLLIVIGQLGKRGKEMAVRKCYGTSNRKLFLRIMGESVFFLVVSIALAVLIVLSLSDQCEMLLGYPASVLLSSPDVWLVETCVCVALLLITGVIPAWIYCRTPVSHVFHQNTRRRKVWKLALLTVQFFATGLMFCLLLLVYRQYHMMSHGDMGYEYENVALLETGSLPQNEKRALKDELSRLACVEAVSSADQNFTGLSRSGNNVWMEDDPDKDNQVNVTDMYYANPDIFDEMGMEFVQGGTFRENADSTVHQVVVEEGFVDVMKKYFGHKDDNIVGERFNITEHKGLDGTSEFIISGVIRKMRRGGFNSEYADNRAGVLFPSSDVCRNLYVRFSNLTPETLQEAQNIIDRNHAGDLYIMPFKAQVLAMIAPVKRFGFSVMAAGIAILLITIIGLIGYTADEVQRRAKEIAIRKVNGTTVGKILRIFCVDILKVAVPSLLAGGIAAVLIGRDWLSQFTDQVSLSPWSMALCLLVILVVIIAVVCLNALKVARSNPVDYLRTE